MTFIQLFVAAWSIRIVAAICSYVSLWYVKEYRFDRMLIHLKTPQGQRILFSPFRRPPMTPKAAVLFVGTAAVLTTGYVMFTDIHPVIRMLLLDLFTFPVTAFFVLLTKIPTYFYHMYRIRQAVRLLRAHRHMTVIGITGSYGKTSTKEILASLLSAKMPTLKTEASKNSPIGIAELVLSSLRPDHKAFVVEMGAYKMGEIAYMGSMVQPEVAIVTAINAQHQDLFGSIENTMRAKYELISGLTGSKIAVINADNEKTRVMAESAKKEGVTVLFYSTEKNRESGLGEICVTSDIVQSDSGISFDIRYQNKNGHVSVPLLGVHHASNILAALTASVAAGMTFDEAVQASRNIRPQERIMQYVAGIRGSVFIDDTFNNNPEAAIAAINYLKTRKPKRILVFQPMIELGNFTRDSHKRVGSDAAKVCDTIILTNNNFHDYFMQGVRESGSTPLVRILSGAEGAAYLKKCIAQDDTVLFKGKESSKILRLLKLEALS